jgi:hypothetical protein
MNRVYVLTSLIVNIYETMHSLKVTQEGVQTCCCREGANPMDVYDYYPLGSTEG